MKHPPIKTLHDQTTEAAERFQQKIGEHHKADFLQWEETYNYLHSRELEWLYMQGVKDGAQILLSLLYDQNEQHAIVTKHGNKASGG